MFRFLRGRARGGSVGVAFDGDGAAVVALRPGTRDRAPSLLGCEYLNGGRADAAAMKSWAERNRAARAPAVALLAPGEYRVMQIDAPPVPPAEMRVAAGWRVRELLDYPLDQAVIDTFAVPAPAQRGTARVSVVAAHRDAVAARITLLRAAGFDLQAIDIPELAQGEAGDWLPADEHGHALLALDAESGMLTISRDGEQYLARPFDTGLSAIGRGADGIEALVLEVQRSFDYFESAMSQAPVGALYVHPSDDATDRLAREIESSLGSVACKAVSLGDLVEVEREPEHAGATMLHALGASLRRVESGT